MTEDQQPQSQPWLQLNGIASRVASFALVLVLGLMTWGGTTLLSIDRRIADIEKQLAIRDERLAEHQRSFDSRFAHLGAANVERSRITDSRLVNLESDVRGIRERLYECCQKRN